MDIVDYIEFGILYATVVTFIFRYNQLDYPFRKLIFYLFHLVIGNTLALYIFAYLHQENLWLFHFLTPLEYTTLCIVFYHSFESRFLKKVILLSIPGFVILCIILTLYVDQLNENDSIARVVEALLITRWILLYFRQLSTTDKILNIKREPLFWVYSGLMIYFWGTLFLQGFLNYLNKLDRTLANELYTWQYILEYLSMIAINIGMFCQKMFKRPHSGRIA